MKGQPSRLTRPLALVDVNVLTMKGDELLPHQTIIIDSGNITSIAPKEQIAVDGMEIVDLAGRYAIPGLADMHVHTWDPGELGLFLANGVTVVRNMWGSGLHRALDEEVRRGERPGPRILTTSPLIDGLNEEGRTLWPHSDYLSDDLGKAKRLVDRYADQGYDQIKAYSLLTRDQLKALGEACRERGVRLVGHCPNPLTFEEAIDIGMNCFEHLTNVFYGHLEGGRELDHRLWWDPEGMKSLMRMLAAHADMEALRRLSGKMAEAGAWNCVTTTVWQGPIDGVEAFNDRRMDFVPFGEQQWWQTRALADPELKDLHRVDVEQRLQVLSYLREEGAPVLVGTDTPNPFVVQGFAVHDELSNFVDAGFTPTEALRTATYEAARYAGEEDEWGAIAEGMRGDIVVLDSDPRQSLAVLRQPFALATNGYFFNRDDLDALLEERAKAVKDVAGFEEKHLDHETGQRHFTQTQFGATNGKICCHAIPRDDTLVIEEEASDTQQSTRRTIILGPSREILRFDEEVRSPAGRGLLEIKREEDGYGSERRDVDGSIISSRLDCPALPPSEEFGFAALSEVVGGLQDGDGQTLGLISGELTVIPARVTRSEGEVKVEWLREGWPTTQSFLLDRGGRVVGLKDEPWGPREITEEL